jgi:regulator of protease activity HflC (stomatin/prohibitin superfamily)
VLLGEGLHVYNEATFRFEKALDTNSVHISHGTIHVIRVPKGKFALVWDGTEGGLQPKMLAEGLHVTDSSLFQFTKTVDVSETVISHGNLHLVRVNKGWVAKVVQDNVPRLLGEGSHWRNSTNFQHVGTASQLDDLIQHGTITRFRIRKGQVACAWHNNEPLLLQEPGEYQFDTPQFQFVRFVSASERVLELGARKIVTVQSGEVGISFNQGQLEILPPGRHLIEKAEHRIECFWSTQQRSMRLVSVAVDALVKQKKSVAVPGDAEGSDLLICETKDFVKVGVRADVFYSIEDPYKAVVAVGKEETEPLVRETSIATLTNIIRSTALSEMAQSSLPNAVSEEKTRASLAVSQATGQATAPLFFDRAHDAFLAKLHDDFLNRYGINVSNIRIESFRIMDDSLATEISKQAVVTAKTQSTLANLQGETEIATAKQDREATVRKIEADMAAQVLMTQTKSENDAQIARADASAKAKQIETELQATAEANALLSRAKAEADATRIKAEADAHAISVCAAAEAQRADMLSKTTIGGQLALLDTYKQMVQSSNDGVEKVVYMDPSLARVGNPLGPATLQGMAADLSMLQDVGKA